MLYIDGHMDDFNLHLSVSLNLQWVRHLEDGSFNYIDGIHE